QFGQITQCVSGGDLHLFVDTGSTHVERTAEDEGEAQYVVDLVRVVRTPGGHDHVGTGRMGQLRADFRIGVGAGEHHRIGCHAVEAFGAQQVGARQANENIRAVERIFQSALVGLVCEHSLVLGQIITPGMHHAPAVDPEGSLDLCTHANQQLHAGSGRRTGAHANDFCLFQRLAGNFQCVEHASRGHDRGAVLVIMEYRDIALLDQRALDFEALGRLDVLEIDAAEGDGDALDRIDKGLRALCVHFDVEYIDTGEALEQYAFTFHHRLGGQRAEVAQAKNGSTVGNHGHKVAFAGVAVSQFGVAANFAYRLGNAWAIGQGQIASGGSWLGQLDAQL